MWRGVVGLVVVGLVVQAVRAQSCDEGQGSCDCQCLGGLGDCLCDESGWVINEVLPGHNGFVEIVNTRETRTMNGLSLWLNGKPWIPIDGEIRVPAGHAVVLAGDTTGLSGFVLDLDENEACQISVDDAEYIEEETGAQFFFTGPLAVDYGDLVALVASDGTVQDVFQIPEIPTCGSVTRSTDVDKASEEVYHVSVTNPERYLCSPGLRTDLSHFAKVTFAEILVDPLDLDINLDGLVDELVNRDFGGWQDAFFELANQECHPVDVSGYRVEIRCPGLCRPSQDPSDNRCVALVPPEEQPFNPYHIFPPGTVLPPGGSVVVFGGRNRTTAELFWDDVEIEPFGWSIVQVSSVQVGAIAEDPDEAELDVFPSGDPADNDQDYLALLLASLPCQSCLPSEDEDCSDVSEYYLMGSDPALTYRLRSPLGTTRSDALVTISQLQPGVSIRRDPFTSGSAFQSTCLLADLECPDDTCSTPGYTYDSDLYGQPDVYVVLSALNASEGCTTDPYTPNGGNPYTFEAVITNNGNQPARNVVYLHEDFEYGRLVAGSVRINDEVVNCHVLTGNAYGDRYVEVSIPELCVCPELSVIITYEVEFIEPVEECVEDLLLEWETQAGAVWSNGPVQSVSSTSVVTTADTPTPVTHCLSRDLEVVVAPFDSCFAPGSDVTTSFTVTNVGNSATCGVDTNVVLTNPPPGLESCIVTYIDSPVDPILGAGTGDSTRRGEVSCTLPTIYPDHPYEFGLAVDVNGFESDPQVHDVTECLFDDLVLLKTAADCNGECCYNGESVFYTIEILNNGNRAIDLTVEDLREHQDLAILQLGTVEVQPPEANALVVSGATQGDTDVEVYFEDFTVRSATITYTWEVREYFAVEDGDVLSNQASSSWTFQGELQGTGLSSSSEEVARVPTTTCLFSDPDVRVNKTCLNGPHAVGDVLEYTITLFNDGNQYADVTVLDAIDTDVVTDLAFVFPEGVEVTLDPTGDIGFSNIILGAEPVVLYYQATVKSFPLPGFEPGVPYLGLGQPVAGVARWGPELAYKDSFEDAAKDCGFVDGEISVFVSSTFACTTEEPVEAGSDVTLELAVTNDREFSNQMTELTLQMEAENCEVTGYRVDAPDSTFAIELPGPFDFTELNTTYLAVEETVTITFTCKVDEYLSWDDAVTGLDAVLVFGLESPTPGAAPLEAKCLLGSPVEMEATLVDGCPASSSPGGYELLSFQVLNKGAREAGNVTVFATADLVAESNLPTAECEADGRYAITISTLGSEIGRTCDYESLFNAEEGLALGDLAPGGSCLTVEYWVQTTCPVRWGPTVNHGLSVEGRYLDITATVCDECDAPYEVRTPAEECTVPILELTGLTDVHLTKDANVSAGFLLDSHLYQGYQLPEDLADAAVRGDDVFHFTLSVTSDGNQIVDVLSIVDEVRDQMSLVSGTVVLDNPGCSVVEGNKPGDDDVRVDCWQLGASCAGTADVLSTVTVDFDVVMDKSLAYHDFDACNQANASATGEFEDFYTAIPSDDPTTKVLCDSTCVPLDFKPDLRLAASCLPEPLTAGATAECEVSVKLGDTQGSDGLIVDISFDENLRLVPGSVSGRKVPRGFEDPTLPQESEAECLFADDRTLCEGNFADDTTVRVYMGALDYFDYPEYRVRFRAVVANPFSVPVGAADDNHTFATFDVVVGRAGLDAELPTCQYYDLCILETLGAEVDLLRTTIAATKTATYGAINGLLPGQRVRYHVTVANVGSIRGEYALVDELTAYDPEQCVGPQLVLVPGTVRAEHGSVLEGNRADDRDVQVDFGVLLPTDYGSLTFEATIADPWPCRALSAENQALVTEATLGVAAVTDDPHTDTILDPTAVPITAFPLVSSYKAATVDGTPFACPGSETPTVVAGGDVLVFEVLVRNQGNQPAFDVVVTDCLDDALTFLPGSVHLNGEPVPYQDVVDVDTSLPATAATRTFAAFIGAVPGDSDYVLQFSANVSEVLDSAGIRDVSYVEGSNIARVESTAVNTLEDGKPVAEVSAVADVDLDVTLAWQPAADDAAPLSPGSVVYFTLKAASPAGSAGVARDVELLDPFTDALLSVELGSVEATFDYGSGEAIVLEGNSVEDTRVRVVVSRILPGGSVSVTYRATLAAGFPAFTTQATAQGTVSGSNFDSVVSRDLTTPVIDDPTIIPLTSGAAVELYSSVFYDGQTLVVSDETPGVRPGDQFEVTLSVVNSGDADLADAYVRVEMDLQTTFVAGSVYVNYAGATVEAGNFVGDEGPIEVALGSFAAGDTAAIRFTAGLSSPFSTEDLLVSFPVYVAADNLAATLLYADVPVDATPSLSVTLTCDRCFNNPDPDCDVLFPGAVIQNTVTITNAGDHTAFDLIFEDSPSATLASAGDAFNFVPAELGNGATSLSNPANNGSLYVFIPELPGGGSSVSFSYNMEVTDVAAPGGGLQAILVSSNDGTAVFSGVFSCDSENPASFDAAERRFEEATSRQLAGACPPTFFPCPSTNGFVVNRVDACGSITASLLSDNDGNGSPSTGDVLLFTANSYIQSSCGNLDYVQFLSTIDPTDGRIVRDSVKTTLGAISTGRAHEEYVVAVEFGSLPSGRQIAIAMSWEVEITGIATGVEELSNAAFILADRYPRTDIALTPAVFYTTEFPSSASALTSSFAMISSTIIMLLLAAY
eukprot:CAMPEP_0119118282 /NCGR_PEP_ID=MMETSP1310-20130426/173_1 /TAXON_ID=464262 /ORGANISM="Genus nov. species nov., Strain RCC2339" /LENGTH=2657 /DNA_ID=CAMNT_0007107621 /DNA_START=51 /DNA_END=8024 /DNA_ORIENTATION=-